MKHTNRALDQRIAVSRTQERLGASHPPTSATGQDADDIADVVRRLPAIC
jgi:hypothetical protein